MSVHFQINIDGETTEDAIAEFKRVFSGLCSGESSYPTAANEALKNAAAADDVKTGDILEPEKPKPARKKKDKEPATVDNAPLADASTADNPQPSTQSEPEGSSESASDAPSAPDIEDVRSKLKKLGATDGLGHDKVFEVLGRYGAKNASTVPEDKRAALIAEIDELLAGAK